MIGFRSARKEDLQKIYEIEQKVFENPWTLEQLSTEFERKKVTIIDLITMDDLVIGYLMAYAIENDVQIINVAIDVPYQHRGFGKQLMNNFLSRHIDNSVVTLEVKQSNLNAIKLYLDLGFCEIDRREKYYHDGEDAIVMAIGLDS